jgi:hypothetical protein
MWEYGTANRRPFVPPYRAVLAARPTQMVDTGDRMDCIVS